LVWSSGFLFQVSKALLSEYVAAKKKNKPFKGLGLEHMNGPVPVIQSNLTSTTLRNSQFQVMSKFVSILTFLNICHMPNRLCASDECSLLEGTRSSEPFCCRSFTISIKGRKQRASIYSGRDAFLVIKLVLSCSTPVILIVVVDEILL